MAPRAGYIGWIGGVGLALALGAMAAFVDDRASGSGTDAWRAAGIVLNAGAVWAGAAVLAGHLVRHPAASAVAGVTALVAAVAGYYVVGVTFGDRTAVGWETVSGAARAWLTAAIAVGPALGFVGYLARRRNTMGLAARLVIPAALMAEVVFRFRLSTAAFAYDPWWAWTVLGLAVVGALAGIVVVGRSFSRRSR